MAQKVLAALTVLAGAGLTINLLWPPTTYGYEPEQALLVALGIMALWLSRYAVNIAVTLYCSLALLPVLAMMEYHQRVQGGEWAKLTAVPFVGVFVVAALTRDGPAVVGYTICATVANCVIGAIYGDAGAAGALVVITIVAGMAWGAWCRREQNNAVDNAAIRESQKEIQRGMKLIDAGMEALANGRQRPPG